MNGVSGLPGPEPATTTPAPSSYSPAPARAGSGRWAAGWAALVLLVCFFPFMLGYYLSPEDGRFMGLLWNVPDANSYLSRMEWGRRGEWTLQLLYTSEEHPRIVVYIFYLLLGKLAGLLALPNVLVFHLARVATGALLLWASWKFIGRYFQERTRQRITFLLVCFGSGLGWLAGPLGLRDSTDLWVAESLTFFSILAQPHYPLATALLLLALMWLQDVLESTGQSARQGWLKAGLAVAGLGWVHPFLVITFGVVAGLYLLRQNIARRRFERGSWLALIAIGAVALPVPVYVYLATTGNPIYAAWMQQNQTLSPLPVFYMLGYGLLFGLALVGGWWAERLSPPSERPRWQLITTWVTATAVLLYLPLSFQRRFVEGLHLPVVLLATAGLFYLLRNLTPRRQTRRAYQLVILASLSTWLVTAIFLGNLLNRSDDGDIHPLYLYGEEITALNWLRANTALNEVVIAGPILGNYIPGYAGNRVFFGHDLETIHRDEKIGLLGRFFRFQMNRAELTGFLRRYNITYVFIGPDEARLFAAREDNAPADPPDFSSLQELGWQPVYANARVKIYRV